jgi:hypothetical protein
MHKKPVSAINIDDMDILEPMGGPNCRIYATPVGILMT